VRQKGFTMAVNGTLAELTDADPGSISLTSFLATVAEMCPRSSPSGHWHTPSCASLRPIPQQQPCGWHAAAEMGMGTRLCHLVPAGDGGACLPESEPVAAASDAVTNWRHQQQPWTCGASLPPPLTPPPTRAFFPDTGRPADATHPAGPKRKAASAYATPHDGAGSSFSSGGPGDASPADATAPTYGVQHDCWQYAPPPARHPPPPASPAFHYAFGPTPPWIASGCVHSTEPQPRQYLLNSPSAAAPPLPSPKRSKPMTTALTDRVCSICGVTKTPKWRCGGTLCNACGLDAQKKKRGGKGHDVARLAAPCAAPLALMASLPAVDIPSLPVGFGISQQASSTSLPLAFAQPLDTATHGEGVVPTDAHPHVMALTLPPERMDEAVWRRCEAAASGVDLAPSEAQRSQPLHGGMGLSPPTRQHAARGLDTDDAGGEGGTLPSRAAAPIQADDALGATRAVRAAVSAGFGHGGARADGATEDEEFMDGFIDLVE